MKATGIIRRLDNLGRLVIPKEIRKLYQLKEGDPIEFYTSDSNQIIIKKFHYFSSFQTQILGMLQVFEKLYSTPLYFYSDDGYLSLNQDGNRFSSDLASKMRVYHFKTYPSVLLYKDDLTPSALSVFPLVCDGHWMGCFFLLEDSISSNKKEGIQIYLNLLARQIE